MLLGHWYLVQPGLPRRLLLELVRAAMLDLAGRGRAAAGPAGMVQVLTGHDRRRLGRHARLVLGGVRGHDPGAPLRHPAALRERQYSAVMAATGLLYLAILTAFGTDLVARAVLAG